MPLSNNVTIMGTDLEVIDEIFQHQSSLSPAGEREL